MSDAPKQALEYPPLGLLPTGVLNRRIHTREIWAVRMVLLWLLLAIATVFPWPGSATVSSAMTWIGAVAWTAFLIWVAWRWLRLLRQTGRDWLHRSGLSPRMQSLSRITLGACMPLFVVAMWTPIPLDAPYAVLLVSRVPLIVGLVLLIWVVPTGLSRQDAEAEPATGSRATASLDH